MFVCCVCVVQGSDLTEEMRKAKEAELAQLENQQKDKIKQIHKKKVTKRYSKIRFFGKLEEWPLAIVPANSAGPVSLFNASVSCGALHLCVLPPFASRGMHRTTKA